MRDRIPSNRFSEPIEEAISIVSDFWPLLAHVRFVCGIDPIWAGIHHFEAANNSRSYRNTAHVVYPFHVLGPRSWRSTAVIMPLPLEPVYIVHELGHVLDEALGFEHQARPVTDYAHTNRNEAFAEAFTSRFFWNYDERDLAAQDRATVELLDGLVA
jgi:hypothetical protein